MDECASWPLIGGRHLIEIPTIGRPPLLIDHGADEARGNIELAAKGTIYLLAIIRGNYHVVVAHKVNDETKRWFPLAN